MGDPEAGPWLWPDSLDALAAAPESHRLLFENDAVRVLETRIAPGQATQVHTHRWPGILYCSRSAISCAAMARGWSLVDTREVGGLPQPDTELWSGALPPHTLENVDSSEIRVVNVELKTRMSIMPRLSMFGWASSGMSGRGCTDECRGEVFVGKVA